MNKSVTINYPCLDGVLRSVNYKFDLGKQMHAHIHSFLANKMFYEPDVSQVALRIIRPGDCILDVGANIGYFSCLFASLVGTDGDIIAFEPDPMNIEDLKINIGANNFADRVTVVDSPAADSVKEVDFFLNRSSSGGSALWDPAEWKVPQSREKVRLSTTTLDNEVDKRGLENIKLVKIDTEGAELIVLKGLRESLEKGKVEFVIAELHEYGLEKFGMTQHDLRGFMYLFGYETYMIGYKASLPWHVPINTTIHTSSIGNLLFAKPSSISHYWKSAEFNLLSF